MPESGGASVSIVLGYVLDRHKENTARVRPEINYHRIIYFDCLGACGQDVSDKKDVLTGARRFIGAAAGVAVDGVLPAGPAFGPRAGRADEKVAGAAEAFGKDRRRVVRAGGDFWVPNPGGG